VPLGNKLGMLLLGVAFGVGFMVAPGKKLGHEALGKELGPELDPVLSVALNPWFRAERRVPLFGIHLIHLYTSTVARVDKKHLKRGGSIVKVHLPPEQLPSR
jgi:hypothetical protein